MKPTSLSPQARSRTLRELEHGKPLDVLVVGGGINGAGAALDAVTRGLRTGLVETRDYASGTSSRSSKLIHGGIRYLEMLDLTLVYEALQERGRLIDHIAPHLVRPVRFLTPLTSPVWQRLYFGAGVAVYDAMANVRGAGGGLPLQRQLTRSQALKIFPSLKGSAITGALLFSEAQVDDARLVLEIVRSAASYGALVANRVEVTGFLRQGERVVGVRAHDRESSRDFTIQAEQVISATGVWTGDIHQMLDERASFNVRASKGVHLVIPRDRIHAEVGMAMKTDRSLLFIIPWGRHWILGTTDTDWRLDKAHPAATSADIDYILGWANTFLVTPLTHADVEGVYAGLRPLLSGESEETSRLSREHIVKHAAPGLVVVAGGKYTTYRVVAQDAVDRAVFALGRRVPACETATLPLLGAQGYAATRNQRSHLAQRYGVHVARVDHLLGRYGSLAVEVLDLIAEDPSLADPLPHADDYLGAEVAYAAAAEGAIHLDDVLSRRTRISIEAWDRGVGAAPRAAAIMAAVLGWSPEHAAHEVELYAERVMAERESQRMPDDASADAARRKARDVVGGWTHRP
ncbi:MAG: glycerol-3-phosphate dehydrogenase/oxidase [Austwickia sp.]|jgi:glycerol-3-phosphate dehydrogenase|nr:glycerol-3-phosphate dehydrogenase/oxidase [Austwickia sp.]